MGGVVGGARFRMDVNGSMAKQIIWECQSGSGKYQGGEELQARVSVEAVGTRMGFGRQGGGGGGGMSRMLPMF